MNHSDAWIRRVGRGRAGLAGLMAGVVMAVLLVAAPAAQAGTAVSCTSQAVQNSDDGYAYMMVSANLKRAPYAECGNVTYLTTGTKLWIWCWILNDYGNSWFWARVAGTETYGWVSAANVSSYSMPIYDGGFCQNEPA